MKAKFSQKLGEVQISPEVIKTYAGTTAVECFGIVGMAKVSMRDGLVHLLRPESLTKGISVEIEEDGIRLEFHVIVSYGVNIPAVTDNLMENVRYAVQEFTGMKVQQVRVYVEGIRRIDD